MEGKRVDPNAVNSGGKNRENKRRALIKAVTVNTRQNRAKKQNKKLQGKLTT